MTMTERPKRITTRQIGAGEDAALAVRLGGDLRVGNFQGVHIDFRHPELPIGEWEALPQWPVWGEPPVNAGIIFPSEARFGIAELRKVKAMPDQPAVYAQPQDRITIERVEVQASERLFDHPHDREVRLAFLRIERPTGEVLRPPGPLAFFGKGRILRHATRESFDHIIERALRLAGLDGFPPRPVDYFFRKRTPEDEAIFAAAEAHGDYFKLFERLSGDDMGRAYLRSLANQAALMGFLVAKLEARTAERAGGGVMRNRAKATEAITRVDWHAKAKALWAEHPGWTLNRVSELIADEDGSAETRSVARSIRAARGIIPPTSPSYKGR